MRSWRPAFGVTVRADFPDHHTGGVIGEQGGFQRRRAGRNSRGEASDHGVAGTGDIVHLLRHRGDHHRPCAALGQYALFAQGHENNAG